jgi:hypothetical protein
MPDVAGVIGCWKMLMTLAGEGRAPVCLVHCLPRVTAPRVAEDATFH